MHVSAKESLRDHDGPSRWGWAFLLCALLTAVALRFWQLGDAPPGLYRDEALNGLDALGVLNGRHALFFAANNGREPSYIYLTAGAIALFGRTAIAVRLAAAAAGVVTTALTYRLARVWFGWRAGLFAAWLWAVTLWPVHLSRIGLRPILLAPLLALTFWLGTIAYRRQQSWLWLLAGIAYGATFYTYLAARFTPLLLILLLSYLLLSRSGRRRLWPGIGFFALGALLVLLPLADYVGQRPDLFLDRARQVSILNPAVNGGDLWGTLWEHVWRSLGLFLWKGDTIVRHNPAGRPVFGAFMVLPFLIGLGWCLRHIARPAALALLAWLLLMLGPTILAEDAPHFLRAAGLLPAVTILPALGLSKLWEWPKLSDALRRGAVIVFALGTLITTIVDYAAYVRQPDTAYLFEAAARELAEKVNEEEEATTQYLDRRFWEGWPSIPFLVDRTRLPVLFTPVETLAPAPLPLSIYAWPHGSLEYVSQAVAAPAAVFVQRGGLARNDLETEAYPLYVRYAAGPRPSMEAIVATFGDNIQLLGAEIESPASEQLQVDLYWTAGEQLPEPLVAFVHVLGEGERIGQSDRPPGHGYWLPSWWQAGIVIHERRVVDLQEAYDSARHQIIVGLYKATTGERLPVFDADGQPAGDTWLLQVQPPAY